MPGVALVTGGAGFIGTNLVRRLVADGHAVRVLDRRPPVPLDGVDWVEGDVRDARVVGPATAGASVIYHLASVVGVDALLADPVEAVDVAVSGTLRVLDAIGRSRTPLVHLSTSEVLGVNPAVPWAEDAERVLGSTWSDRWSYATAKAAAEHLVLGRKGARGGPTTVVRPFNVYGPGQEPRFVVAAMVAAAVEGAAITVDGTGAQTRCFTYVDDLVEGLVRVGGAAGRVPVVHLGSEDERTILELAKLVQEAVGTDVPIVFREFDERWAQDVPDVPRRVPDAGLALSAFGWRATTPLNDGLAKVVGWARDQGDRAAIPAGRS